MISLCLGLLLAAVPAADPAASQAWLQRVYERTRASLVQVGPDAAGEGVVIAEAGVLVAPSAVVGGGPDVTIAFVNGYRAAARVIARDEGLGLALLRIDGAPPMANVRLNAAPPAVGQAAYSLSFSRPQTPMVSFARIATGSAVRGGRVDDRLFTARFALPSKVRGAAVLGWDGELLGVALASDDRGTAFALSSGAILQFVGAHAQDLPKIALRVASQPAGAQVLLDGRAVGRTPAMLPEVSAGAHMLVLRAPGLPDAVRNVVALGRSKQDLSILLLPGAAVAVDTQPGAQVWIDGVLRGVGPSRLWLPEGKHWIAATFAGHRPFGRWVEVVGGRPLAVQARLEEARAVLSVDSEPRGAAVSLDDNRIGVTPLESAAVVPGTYALTLSAPGYHTLRMPVTVADRASVDLGKVALERPAMIVRFQAPPETEAAIDGGKRHRVIAGGEKLAPGEHRAVLFAPFQYRTEVGFRGADGEAVDVRPTFIPAGKPEDREVLHTVSALMEGASGLFVLASGVMFLAAEGDRDSNGSTLSSSGHAAISTGLGTGAIALGLFGGARLLDSLQPTPEMGHGQLAPGGP